MKYFYQQNPTVLKNLSKNLKNRIYGQDHIINALVDMLMIRMSGLADDNKPIGSFLFTGPTGVGKTELAKELAKMLDIHFERFDMSEYADEYSARNLTGGQKGLVGYEDGGLLTNVINKNPHCVLLLDEIEKAHKVIYNSFLQVLDYGTLTDTQGNKTDFTNVIIILTSNLGVSEKRGIGFGEHENIYRESEVINFLSPEFRNRLDRILEFNKLTDEISMKVTDKYLSDFKYKLSSQNVSLMISERAKKTLNEIGFDQDMGARSVYRAINNEFKQNISKEILFGKLLNGGNVSIDIDDKSFIYSYKVVQNNDIEDKAENESNIEFDFETAEEALTYAKRNLGTCITRSKTGYGYIIKNKTDIN